MKITKKTLTESANKELETKDITETLVEDDAAENNAEEEIVIDNVDTAATDEIADAVQAAAEEASDGKETFSDAKAAFSTSSFVA